MTDLPAIDLNCDLGEGAGSDELLMRLISSTNIACGSHAGDLETMRATVRLARNHGVAIGAHPGFADREFFGRRELMLPAREITQLVRDQVEALSRICTEESTRVRYVKPHGALYNMAASDETVAAAVVEGVALVDPRLGLIGLAGGCLLAAGRARGLRVASEVFADRSYRADGSLTPRNQPHAILSSVDAAVEQVIRMIREGTVRAIGGCEIGIVAETVCLHGDGPDAVVFAQALRTALGRERVRVAGYFI